MKHRPITIGPAVSVLVRLEREHAEKHQEPDVPPNRPKRCPQCHQRTVGMAHLPTANGLLGPEPAGHPGWRVWSCAREGCTWMDLQGAVPGKGPEADER